MKQKFHSQFCLSLGAIRIYWVLISLSFSHTQQDVENNIRKNVLEARKSVEKKSVLAA